METARKVVIIVRGHDSISAIEMENLGKGVNQLEKIRASMASLKSQLSSTGAADQGRLMKSYVSNILQGRPLESIKMICLQLDVVDD